MNNEPVAWKAYEEVNFKGKYILRWVREGDEYVNRMNKEMMKDYKSLAEKELTDEEIEDIASSLIGGGKSYNILFARAILRKAQE